MKTRKAAIIFVASCVLSMFLVRSSVQAQPRPQQPEPNAAAMSEIQTLWEQAQQLRGEGKLKAAVETTKKLLTMEQLLQDEPNGDLADLLEYQAQMQELMRDYRAAEASFEEVLSIRTRVFGKENWHTTGARVALKEVRLLRQLIPEQRRRLKTAEELIETSSTIFGEGEFAAAIVPCRQALEIRRAVLGEQHSTTVSNLKALTLLYYSLGDYANAILPCQQSLDICKNIFGKRHPETAQLLNDVAELYRLQGHNVKAEPLFRQSLEIRKNVLGEQHPDTSTTLNNLGLLYQSQGDYAKADSLFRRGLETSKTLLEAASLVQSERRQLAMARDLRFHLDSYLALATVSKKHAESAYREVLNWKGATFVRQQQLRKATENADVAPLFKQLPQTAMRLATLSRMVPEPQQQSAWRRQITDLTAAKERLEADLSQKSSEFREAQKQVTLEDMLSVLPKDAALVDFLEYGRFNLELEGDQAIRYVRSTLAFVIRGGEPVVMLDLGPAAPVSEAIDTWRRTFGMSQDGVAAGRLLREEIWEPIEKHLEGSKLVLVSTDGVLGRLPLGALPGKEGGKYLLEDYRLAMLPVPQLLPAMVSRSGRKELEGGLLVMGDVDYDADPQTAPQLPDTAPSFSTAMVRGADTDFSRLPATVSEIDTIKEVFAALFAPEPDAIMTLSQAEATEQQFRQAASKFYNLHLATHGFFAAPEKRSALAGDNREQFQTSLDRDQLIRGFNPGLLSGLVFSGANRKAEADKDDGILTADEIAALSLEGADLVVLSACETGLGEVAGGEGVLGVQRAFQVAGARSTVASLWQVGDVATQLLMERFYRNYVSAHQNGCWRLGYFEDFGNSQKGAEGCREDRTR